MPCIIIQNQIILNILRFSTKIELLFSRTDPWHWYYYTYFIDFMHSSTEIRIDRIVMICDETIDQSDWNDKRWWCTIAFRLRWKWRGKGDKAVCIERWIWWKGMANEQQFGRPYIGIGAFICSSCSTVPAHKLCITMEIEIEWKDTSIVSMNLFN